MVVRLRNLRLNRESLPQDRLRAPSLFWWARKTRAHPAAKRPDGGESRRLAVLLQEYALVLRAHNDDASAEPVLRQALAVQAKVPEPDYHLTTAILNTLGNLLEGRREFEEAEKLERAALHLSEEKFGPESADLATTCTYLADVLWNKKELRAAGELFRRAVAIELRSMAPNSLRPRLISLT